MNLSQPGKLKRISVFCGSRNGIHPSYARAAEALGRALVQRGIGLVYGGGGVGMMGKVSETVKNSGGQIIGIIPKALLAREVGRADIGELRIVRSMHERKAMMVEISDGFIAMPGGFGTFEEFCEIVTWAQLGLHAKPVGLLNVNSYFDPLIEQFDRAVTEEFAYPENRRLILHETNPDRLLDLMGSYEPPDVEQWIDPDEA
ncbi:MAG TPA: TIGR00730 family Rossman fold protein [Terriglobia bacterium]|nr:TIGR00730 family Rossman fold protein [Terriglobia bacterium]